MLEPGGSELADRGVVLEQARLQVRSEDQQLALGRPARPGLARAAEGQPVPGLRERDQTCAPAGAMRGEHRADAVAGGVRPDDDLVGGDPLQHRDPRPPR
jgi:hypothetical protein